MKSSFLSLNSVDFVEVGVKANPDYKGAAENFDFEGVSFYCKPAIGQHPKSEDGLRWWVGLQFAIKPTEDKPAPYFVNLRVIGDFGVAQEVPLDKREKLIFESGTALVYGAMREMVTTITSRSVMGVLVLPTASFFGEYEEYKQKAEKAALGAESKPPSSSPAES
jgi:preprotein translocase subunit SecB